MESTYVFLVENLWGVEHMHWNMLKYTWMVWASPANIVTKHSGQEPPKDSMLKDAWINEKSFILIDFSQTYYIHYYGKFENI